MGQWEGDGQARGLCASGTENEETQQGREERGTEKRRRGGGRVKGRGEGKQKAQRHDQCTDR